MTQQHPDHVDEPVVSSSRKTILFTIGGIVALILIVVILHLTGIVG